MKYLEITENLQQIMKERYYQKGETTPQQMIRRVANYVAQGELQYGWTSGQVSQLSDEYYNTMNERLWLPSSPFLMNAGTKVPMLSACFVVGGVNDDLPSIYEAVKRQGIINKMGGGTGFSFSPLREEGAAIESTGGTSSGVMSFMELFNVNGDVIKQGGRRRSANIGILSVYHPEILKFIDYKQDHNKLNNFNISVLVDDNFMEAVENKENYWLVSPKDNKPLKQLNAYDVYMKIMQNNWTSAEPAIIFLDNLNVDNPMKCYLGDIVTTNPCGEIPLYGDEACNLASINLEEFVDWEGNIDWDKLRYITRLVIRFLDTSIDVNLFPDEKIDAMVKSLRRLGLGVMSVHGALIKAGLKYSSYEGRSFIEKIQKFISDEAWEMSKELSFEKDVFPLWKYSLFENPTRNVACTTIAPTGTIQQILNTSSSGCEPIFALAYKRNILTNEGTKETFWVNPFFKEFAENKGFWSDDLPELIYKNRGRAKGIDRIPEKYAELFETSMEISAKDHVQMQAALQLYVDNSISKTINMPNEATVEEVAEAYMLGWKLGLKGMTVYREGSRDGVVLEVGGNEKEDNNKKDTNNQDKESAELPRGMIIPAPDTSADSTTKKLVTGCGNIYLTMDKNDNGNIVQTFVNRGSKGTCMSNQNAVSRLISLALRGGINIDDVADQLLSVPVCPSYYGARCSGKKVSKGSSCPSALGIALLQCSVNKKENLAEQKVNKNENTDNQKVIVLPVKKENDYSACPKCGEKMAVESGCVSCYSCGYSKCA